MEPLQRHHVAAIAPRLMARHAAIAKMMLDNPNYAELISAAGPCAAFLHDGVVVAVAGLVDYGTTGRCFIHCAFARDCGKIFAPLIYNMRRALLFYPRRRYEAYIPPDFLNGRRLVKWAKFKYEGLMEAFAEDGADRELWVLVRKGAKA